MLIREFQPLDLHRIQVADTTLEAGWRHDGPRMAAAGPAWTVLHDGEVLVCVGLALPWRGRACAWCIIGSRFPRRAWPWLHRQVKTGIPRVMAELRLHRIEAEALTGWDPGARWLHKLGFRPEGIMPAYGPAQQDFDRWGFVNLTPAPAQGADRHG
jgi:hypothetical protein